MPIDKRRIEESYNLQADDYRGGKAVANLLLRDMQIPRDPVGLDIGCGPGVTTIALYEKCGLQGKVYGLDISQRMVDRAIENGKKLGYDDLIFVKGDAESLGFPDDMFDVVISLYAFQFFPDKPKALKEMFRVLKPGGWLGLWSTAGEVFMKESFQAFRTVQKMHPEFPRLARVLDEYGEMHITLEEFQDLLGAVGFIDSDVLGRHRVYYVDPRKYLEENPYPIDWLLAIPKESREPVKREVLEEMNRLSDSRGFRLTYYFIQGYARKPA